MGQMDSTEDHLEPGVQEFESLVRAEAGRLYGLAFAILGQPANAEDAVQATFEQAWRAKEKLARADNPGAWLTTVCVRRCLDLRRRLAIARWRRGRASEQSAPHQDVDALLDLRRAYSHLTPSQRAVLSLHLGSGYPLDDCARILGKRPGTVRSHYARALRGIRRELSDG